MYLAATTAKLDGKLVIVSQGDFTAVIQSLFQDEASIHLLAYGYILFKEQQSTEQRTFFDAALAHILGIDNVQTALAAHQYQTVSRITYRALVIRPVLQSVTVVVATHHEMPTAVFLLLWYDVRYAVVGDQPDGTLVVLDESIDGRTEEPRLHVKQVHVACLGIPNGSTR